MSAKIRRLVRRFARDERGATAIEYAFIAVLISIAAIVGFQALGGSLQNMFGSVNSDFAAQIPS